MAIKAGLEFFPPILFAAFRFDIAGVVMLAYAAYVNDTVVPRGRGAWASVLVSALFIFAGYHVLLFIGEADPLVTSAAASVIISLSPILTTALARVFLPTEQLSVVGMCGLFIGLLGVILLARPDPSLIIAQGGSGKLLILAAAGSFAFGSVLTRRFDDSISIETLEAWAMIGGAAIMHAVSASAGESVSAVIWSGEAVAALLYLSVVASALGFLIYFNLLNRVGAIKINLVSYVAPMFAAIAGWMFLDEIPTVYTISGFSLILIGFMLIKWQTLVEIIAVSEHFSHS
ncbi:MAG: putative permease [Haloquadratum sp. J07HQX50]|jgi:EamA-like transporter family.|nr:MAG: putative permease [Haloquadratum sp. J07HQX50]